MGRFWLISLSTFNAPCGSDDMTRWAAWKLKSAKKNPLISAYRRDVRYPMRSIGFVFVFAVDRSITMWSHYSLMVWRGTVELNIHKYTGIISSSFAPGCILKGKNRTVWRWWWPSIHVLKCCPQTDELLLPYLQTWKWSYDSEVRTYIV